MPANRREYNKRETVRHIQSVFLTLYTQKGIQGITVSQLCQACGIAKSTFYLYFEDKFAVLDRMEQGGLVKRRQNPENRREILVSITPEAQRLREGYNAVSQQINEVYYRGFTEEEIQQHETYLARILANLEECEALNGRKTT